MGKTKAKKRANENIQAVKRWIASFVPLIISIVLFVFCFVFESTLWLYVICTLIFALFVFLYVRADKAIQHQDGYTLIQAMHFYLVCLREEADVEAASGHRKARMQETAKKLAFTKQMDAGKIERMYKCGQDLVRHFKVERFSKYV